MVLKLVENFLGGWTELTCLCAILRCLWIAPEKILISPRLDGAAQMASKFTWGEFLQSLRDSILPNSRNYVFYVYIPYHTNNHEYFCVLGF